MTSASLNEYTLDLFSKHYEHPWTVEQAREMVIFINNDNDNKFMIEEIANRCQISNFSLNNWIENGADKRNIIGKKVAQLFNSIYRIESGETPAMLCDAESGLEPLAKYLGGLRFDDLLQLELNELAELIPGGREGILIKIFYNRFLRHKKYYEMASPVDISMDGKIISSKYQGPSSFIPFDTFVNGEIENPRSCNLINLCNNLLMDVDLIFLEKLVVHVVPNLLVLYANRIYCYKNDQDMECFRRILNKVNNYMVIVGNPIASPNNKSDLFLKLTKSEASKLIWVCNADVNTSFWRTMVKPNLVNIIVDAHHKYYASEKHYYSSSD